MTTTCLLCGARYETDGTCREHFDHSQLVEVNQPQYYAVHHLSVPCYMLQHNAYSWRGWLEVRALLERFFHQGLTPQEARREFGGQSGSGRGWSITRGEKLPGVEAVAWSFTIADVRLDTAETYCIDVLRWAESVLKDSASLAAAHQGQVRGLEIRKPDSRRK